jgi:transposase
VLRTRYSTHLTQRRSAGLFADGPWLDIYELITAHVFAAARIHGDDTTVPVLAKVKTRTGRLWTYVRDDQPFGGRDPPAAVYFYSADRAGIHPERHLAG